MNISEIFYSLRLFYTFGLFQIESKFIKSWTFEISPYLFHEGGPYHIETSPLICSAMVTAMVPAIVSIW